MPTDRFNYLSTQVQQYVKLTKLTIDKKIICFMYAYCLETGEGTGKPPNKALAAEWYNKIASSSDSSGFDGFVRELERMTEAVDHPQACFILYRIYSSPDYGIAPDIKKAKKYLKQAVIFEDMDAQFELAERRALGDAAYINKNMDRAKAYYQLAASQQHERAQQRLALFDPAQPQAMSVAACEATLLSGSPPSVSNGAFFPVFAKKQTHRPLYPSLNEYAVDSFPPLKLSAEESLAQFKQVLADDDVNKLFELFNLGLDLTCKDEQGNTPLLLACQVGNIPYIRCLLDSGADDLIVNLYKESALYLFLTYYKTESQHIQLNTDLIDLWDTGLNFGLYRGKRPSILPKEALTIYSEFISDKLVEAVKSNDLDELVSVLEQCSDLRLPIIDPLEPRGLDPDKLALMNQEFELRQAPWVKAFELALNEARMANSEKVAAIGKKSPDLKNKILNECNKYIACVHLLKYSLRACGLKTKELLFDKCTKGEGLEIQHQNEQLMIQMTPTTLSSTPTLKELLIYGTKYNTPPDETVEKTIHDAYDLLCHQDRKSFLGPILNLISCLVRGKYILRLDTQFRLDCNYLGYIYVDPYGHLTNSVHLRNKKFAGVYPINAEDTTNSIFIAAKGYDRPEMKNTPVTAFATLSLHEFSHAAADLTFVLNKGLPFNSSDIETKAQLLGILKRIKQKPVAEQPAPFSRLFSEKNDEMELLRESIAHTMECICLCSNEMNARETLRSIDPQLEVFYFDKFLPAVSRRTEVLEEDLKALPNETPWYLHILPDDRWRLPRVIAMLNKYRPSSSTVSPISLPDSSQAISVNQVCVPASSAPFFRPPKSDKASTSTAEQDRKPLSTASEASPSTIVHTRELPTLLKVSGASTLPTRSVASSVSANIEAKSKTVPYSYGSSFRPKLPPQTASEITAELGWAALPGADITTDRDIATSSSQSQRKSFGPSN